MRMPPPPPPQEDTEHPLADLITSDPFFVPPSMISPNLKRVNFLYAVWVHGDYPQIPWEDAVRRLLSKCLATPTGRIDAAAIWELDRKLPVDTDISLETKNLTRRPSMTY